MSNQSFRAIAGRRSLLRMRQGSAFLGNLVEHYDTALFGLLSPFLAPLIFPKHDSLTALILIYAILPIGMWMRPLGSLVFGFIGGVYGRTRALFISLMGMALVCASMAAIPTYARIGVAAPLLFCLGRALQNFFAAGETMGGAIYLLENSAGSKRDVLSAIFGATSIGGELVASLGVFVLSLYGAVDSGWRLLYLLGCTTALCGLWLRRSSPPDAALQKRAPLIATLWEYRRPLFAIAVCAGFSHATYALALVLMNGLVPLVTEHTKEQMVQLNTCLLLMDVLTLPFFGWLSSKISREKVMSAAALIALCGGLPMLLCLKGASLFGVVVIRMLFVFIGVAFFAPFHAWAQQLVPSHSRYTVLSLGYALGSQLLGSPTAPLALWCFQKTHMLTSIAWLWMALALFSYVLIKQGARQAQQAPSPRAGA